MKNKKDPQSTKSIYEELGYKNYQDMETKANLVMEIAEVIKKKKLTQIQCAAILGISQPKISELLGGRFRGYSVERLMLFLNALGQNITITIQEKPASQSARISVQYRNNRRTVPCHA